MSKFTDRKTLQHTINMYSCSNTNSVKTYVTVYTSRLNLPNVE